MRYNLQTLKVFIAIADEGSIARAAEREHTVASALSRRVAEMEELCGAQLVTRHRRGVALTPAGVELVQHARRVMAELSSLDNALGDYASGVRGQARLLSNTSAIVQFLPQDIAEFLVHHPSVKIDLEERTSDQVQKQVQDGLADIGVMVANRPLEALHCRPYRSDRLFVMMPPGHPLSRKKSLRFADTLAYDHVGLPRGSSLCETLLQAAFELGKPLKLRMQTTSFDGLRRMVASRLGIGVLPEGSVVPFLQTEGIMARPLVEPWATRQLLVVTQPPLLVSRLAAALADHLVAVAAQSIAAATADGAP